MPALRLIDTDLRVDAISLELKLRWPTVTSRTHPLASYLQPYLSVGPAFFVARQDESAAILASRRDPSLSLGVRGGAGLEWQLSENALLFGEYQLTRSGSERLVPLGGRPPSSAIDVEGGDLRYGISVRF
jgi:hypothetical protein